MTEGCSLRVGEETRRDGETEEEFVARLYKGRTVADSVPDLSLE